MAQTPTPDDVAANVRAELARAGVTVLSAAAHLGINRRTMTRRLNGELEFTVGEVTALASLLGVPYAALIGESPAA